MTAAKQDMVACYREESNLPSEKNGLGKHTHRGIHSGGWMGAADMLTCADQSPIDCQRQLGKQNAR
jgi:hypothetical protein